MRTRVRLGLALQLAAVATGVAGVLVAAGLPLLARRTGPVWIVAALALAAAAAVVAVGLAVLIGGVARPVERLLDAAARLSVPAGDLPALGPPGEASGPALHRAAVAFERTVAALEGERLRVAEQLAALERANRELAGAQESLVRSEKLATVGRLAAGIAHEVGNPLGAICGYAELARGRALAGAPAAELADLLARISAEGQRIDRILRDLLDFARPAAPALGPVAVASALDVAARLARVQARARGLEVQAELASGLPPVWADAHRLEQVFLNLLLNAADAMGGQGTVWITARGEGDEVVVRVADAGPGIPAEHLGRVFDPFFTTKPPGEGTGLGLSVCHGILESFGGGITAGNAPDGGAVLTLRLRAAGAGVLESPA
ncbi:MAG TPA: ATP-binding protein [Anaeromyxobacter sp.]|nr:ATP-binding protein [Anaeromyxobacter sp.]